MTAACSAGEDESTSIATIGGADVVEQTAEASAPTTAAPTTEAPTTAAPTTATTAAPTQLSDSGATDEVLSQLEVSELATRGWTTPTGSYSCHGTETLGSVRTVVVPDFLNVRIGPGVRNPRVMRLGPGATVYAYTGFDSDNGRPFTVTDVGQTPWIMIDIPYEGEAGEPAPSGCGFVSTRYLSSSSASNLAAEITG